MSSWLRKIEPFAFALLRIAFGALFVFHGLQKLFGLYGGARVEVLSRLGAAGVIEVAGGVLIALGAWTVPVALIAAVEMGVAYYLAHYAGPPWPIQNGGELAILYGAAFLYIASHGAGGFSADALMKRR